MPMLPVLLAVGVGLLVFLGTRSVSASPAATVPGGGGTVRASPAAWKAAAEAIIGPMPVGPLLENLYHEGGFRPGIVVADMVQGASELGCAQLVVEHDADGNPNLAAAGGAVGADVDPLTMLGAIYGAQWVYARAKRLYAADLAERGMVVPGDDEVPIWTTLMQLQHSIGRTAFKRLMDGAKAARKLHPTAALLYWANDKLPPKVNRMSGDLIRKRVKNCLALPDKGALRAPLPARIDALVERPDGIPRFDANKAKRYILAERRRGTKARQADGSPPGV